MNPVSMLQAVAKVINANIGKEITRKQLLAEAKSNCETVSDRYVDKTRRQLTVCGFLADTGNPGHYIATDKIPRNYTVSQLDKDYKTILDAGYRDPEFICNSETITNNLLACREASRKA